MPLTNIYTLAEEYNEYFNTVIGETNDHITRLSVMTAPYPWHFHPGSAETFIGVEGIVIIETREQRIELRPGDIITIPPRTEHCTRPKGGRSVNLTIERGDLTTVFIEKNA